MTCWASTVSTGQQFIFTEYQKRALGAGTQAHQFQHMTFWASTVNTGPQFIYTGFSEAGSGVNHTRVPVMTYSLLDLNSKNRARTYIHCISEAGSGVWHTTTIYIYTKTFLLKLQNF